MVTECMFAICKSFLLILTLQEADFAFFYSCGMIAIANLKKQSFECRSCKNKTAVSQVLLPYACKLLVSTYWPV